jgi:uncharacterized iron-regulated protein
MGVMLCTIQEVRPESKMSPTPTPAQRSPTAWLQQAVRLLMAVGASLTLGLSPATTAETTPRALQIQGAMADQATLLTLLREADVILLGELHDNPHHHQARANLLRALSGRSLHVVAEHLMAPQKMPAGTPETQLQRLKAAGFDPSGWRWPLHKPLFDATDELGWAVHGGNLTRAQLRSVGHPKLLALLEQAPLSAEAQALLDADLRDGHCGMLPEQHLGHIRQIQRLRDASMALATLEQLPAVVVLGNGHARLDYGVPQILKASRPDLKVVAVGFVEQPPDTSSPFDVSWQSPSIERPDPCQAFRGFSAPSKDAKSGM